MQLIMFQLTHSPGWCSTAVCKWNGCLANQKFLKFLPTLGTRPCWAGILLQILAAAWEERHVWVKCKEEGNKRILSLLKLQTLSANELIKCLCLGRFDQKWLPYGSWMSTSRTCSLLMSFLQLPVWVKASPGQCLHLTEMSPFSLSESGRIFEFVQCVGLYKR